MEILLQTRNAHPILNAQPSNERRTFELPRTVGRMGGEMVLKIFSWLMSLTN